MIEMLGSLYAHLFWADAAIFSAIRNHAGAAADEALRATLHHIVLVQRFFLSRFLDRPFDLGKELIEPPTLDDFEALFRSAHAEEFAFLNQLDPAALSRLIELPHLPDSHPALAEALLQVVMHSQYHRGQCAARLRALGGEPPMTDFIVWIAGRPAPVWESGSEGA
jgi:uncharacterized damage-inducible protein DinB